MKNRNLLKIIIPIFVILLVWIFVVNKEQTDETFLVKVGQKKISVKDFLIRSELTIRPKNFKNKNTTLNNLISEKILALESGQNKAAELNPVFNLKLKGIREQLMRDKLYEVVAYNKVNLDSMVIDTNYKLSMREYVLEFFTISDKKLANRIEKTLDSLPAMSDVMFREVEEILGKKPVHKVTYNDPDDEVIHEALFSNPVRLGAIIGPEKLGNGDYIIMKVMDWIDYPLVEREDQLLRRKKVEEKLHRREAGKLWRSYQASVMGGKKIEFDRQVFNMISDIVIDKYISLDTNDTLHARISDIPMEDPEIDFSLPLFSIDNTEWTIEDFRVAIISHPLVFRTKDIDKHNYKEQLKLAIVDMVRDYYLTQEAYKRTLDKNEDIDRMMEIWTDAFLAQNQKKKVITLALQQGIIHEKDKTGMLHYWEKYLKDLQRKYSNQIQVNYNIFKTISLTNIDFYVIRPGVPYPITVPGFPTLIASRNLDYVKKINQLN